MAEPPALLRHTVCGCIPSADSACENRAWEALGSACLFFVVRSITIKICMVAGEE